MAQLRNMNHTATPIIYYFISLLLLAAFVFGVGAFVWGHRKHSRRAKWLGGGLVALVIILVLAQLGFNAALDWNPQILSDAEIVGTWTDRGVTITLAANGTFTYQIAAGTASGTWTRDDWNLHLQSAGVSDTMRFVQFRGQYRLMPHPPANPDAWDGYLGLSRK